MIVTSPWSRRGRRAVWFSYPRTGPKLLRKSTWETSSRSQKWSGEISRVGRCTLTTSIASRRQILTETLCDPSRFNVGWGSELDPKTGQLVLTYHPDHVWIKTSHDPSQPWQKVAIKERAASNSQPPALYSSSIPLKPAKVEDLKKITEKHLRNRRGLSTWTWWKRSKARSKQAPSITAVNSSHPALHSAGKIPARRAFGIARTCR